MATPNGNESAETPDLESSFNGNSSKTSKRELAQVGSKTHHMVATCPRSPGCPGIVLEFFSVLENVLELGEIS